MIASTLIENEVIGSLLLDPTLLISDMGMSLSPTDFTQPMAKQIYIAFQTLFADNLHISDKEILKFLVEHKAMIYMLVLSIFVGIEIISKVPAVLHTPLMSGANAIHGVVIVGAILVMGAAKEDDTLSLVLGFIAVILGTLNVVGGFVVTDRMLEMFKKKTPAKKG